MNNNVKSALLSIVLTITICAGLLWFTLLTSPSKPVSKVQPETIAKESLVELSRVEKTSSHLVNQADLPRTPTAQDRANFATSLQGTDIDGALTSDKNGNLVLSIDVRDFFDYFLSASDEIGPEAAIDEIIRYAQEYLPEAASKQSIDILRNYLQYKKAELALQNRQVANNGLTDENTHVLLAEYFSSLKGTRSELFTQQADQALFALEDSYSSYTLASLKLRSDSSLSDQEKLQKLEQLREALPAELTLSENNQQQVEFNQKKVSALINSDLDDVQLYDEFLAQGYSKDKAQSLISERHQQKDFEQRYASYSLAKQQAVLEINQKDELHQSDVLKQLRSTYFINSEDRTRAALRDQQ